MNQSGVLVPRALYHTAEVQEVQFSALTSDEIELLSVVEVTQPKLYEANQPVKGGVNDLRLGIIKPGQKCETCGESKECQGHFGHIKLAEPVFHVGYLPFVDKILKCVCHNCGKLKYFGTESQKEKMDQILRVKNPSKRLKQMVALLGQIGRCASEEEVNLKKVGCGSTIPVKIMVKDKMRLLVVDREEKKNNGEIEYSALRVKHIFDKISEHDRKVLGFVITKPNDLLIHILAVSPPQMRPSVELGPEKRAQDDITNAYCRIVLLNRQILNGTDSYQRLILVKETTKIVASIMVKLDRRHLPNLKEKILRKRPLARKIKSIEERLISKEGRFRQHLMGKRVDFSARSVISPDPYLALDEVGVPERIAKGLTIPEEISEFNFEKIVGLCKKGVVKYLLQPQVGRRTPNFIYLNNLESAEDIAKYVTYGTIAERQLQDGDYVLFNRQPTLHRMSMMAHRVRILPLNTFRLNLSVCSPYNADFDGDEMNMHVPQSVEATAQLKHIASVSQQVISPKNSTPVMGLVQDSLLGIYLLTRRDTFLTREEFMNLVIWIEPNRRHPSGDLPLPCLLKPMQLWSGKQVISYLLPERMSLKLYRNNDLRNITDRQGLLIRRGQLVMGSLQRHHVGPGSGALIHALWIQISPGVTNQFITNSQKIVTNWLMSSSFSVGAADVMIDAELEQLRVEELEQINRDYFKNLHMFRNLPQYINENIHQKGRKIADSLEYKINLDLNNALSRMQRILTERLPVEANNIYKMITARSKGSETNLVQIMFCLGNQNVDGRRCPLGFKQRALPHFSKNDNSPEPRGFVFSSFFQGLKPHEFFFHSMAGREGLSDTAVKTSSIGYIQRKLVKALQDLSIRYDASVRDSQGNMLQKFYGEDGFQPEFIERHKFNDAKMSKTDFAKKYFVKADHPSDLIPIELQFRQLMMARKLLRTRLIQESDSQEIEYHAPINIMRLVNKVQELEHGGEIVSPATVVKAVNQLADDCILPQFKRQYDKEMGRLKLQLEDDSVAKAEIDFERHLVKKDEIVRETGMQMFHLHLRVGLNSVKVCQEYRLSQGQLQALCKQVKVKFRQAIAPTGEAIGSLAAQSIGQPTTQMTLNTFHLAGVSDKNVTLGIPRLRQLLDVSKRIKTPYMRVYYHTRLLWEERNSEEMAKIQNIMMSMIPERHIKDCLACTRIFYDAGEYRSNIDGLEQEEALRETRTQWVLRLIFEAGKITTAPIWRKILAALRAQYGRDYQIIEYAGIGDEVRPPEVQLRLSAEAQSRMKDCNSYRNICHRQVELKDIFLSGMRGIKSIKSARKISYQYASGQEMNLALEHRRDELVFDAVGSNLKQCLANPFVDPFKTSSNDLYEVYQVLGIEAARQCFMNEIREVLKPYSIYINNRHVAVLADWMSSRGTLTPVNRHGINRVKDVSILRKASFEETMDILYSAAAFAETDELKGVSERIIFGEKINLGTNSCEIFVNPDTVGKYVYQPMATILQRPQDEEGGQRDGLVTPKGLRTPDLTYSPSPHNSPLNPSYSKSPSYSSGNRGNFSPQSEKQFQQNFHSDSPGYHREPYSISVSRLVPATFTASPNYVQTVDLNNKQEGYVVTDSQSPSYDRNFSQQAIRPTQDILKEEDSDSSEQKH